MRVTLLRYVDEEVVLGGADGGGGGVKAAVQEAAFGVCWPVERRIGIVWRQDLFELTSEDHGLQDMRGRILNMILSSGTF